MGEGCPSRVTEDSSESPLVVCCRADVWPLVSFSSGANCMFTAHRNLTPSPVGEELRLREVSSHFQGHTAPSDLPDTSVPALTHCYTPYGSSCSRHTYLSSTYCVLGSMWGLVYNREQGHMEFPRCPEREGDSKGTSSTSPSIPCT